MTQPDRFARWRWLLWSPNSTASRRLVRINRIYWLTVIYSGAWTLLRAEGIGDWAAPLPAASRVALGFVFLLAVVSLSLRTRMALQRGGYGRTHPSRVGWVFTALDMIALTAAIRLTGGIDSGLWPILFVVVVAETVLEPTREAWFVRLGAALALMVACVPLPLHFGPYLIDLTTRLLFLMAVTTVARRLREGAEYEKSEIAALRAELALTEARSHLAREIHDGVGNTLAAAVLGLEVAAREQERGLSALPVPEQLREEARTLRQAMNTVRDWTFWTRPWPIADGGSVLLVDEVSRLARRTGLAIRLTGAELLDEPFLATPNAASLRLTLFRIAQEALTNVAKHAVGASEAEVTLRRTDTFFCLTIADDGPGLPDAAGSGGIGFASMRERAAGAGGTLTIESGTATLGVRVTARLPLP